MAISDGARKRAPKGCLTIFFLIFTLFGGLFVYVFAVRPLLGVLAARDWPEVECRVLSSQVGHHRGSKGSTTYSIDIRYEYEWHSEKYTSDVWDFQGGSSSGYDGKAEVVARYPVLSTARCYVNPRRPSEAVLHRGLHAGYFFGLIPLIFVAVGLGGLYFVWRAPRPPKPSLPGSLPLDGPRPDDPPGAVILKPATTRGCRLTGAILICLFWNGILSIFVVGFFNKPEGCTGVFLLPFVAIGLALVALVGYTLLALFNPVPVVRASGRSIPLGGMLELDWEIQGNASRFQSLKIAIEGREEATYRRGTRTSTDKVVFERISVYESGPEGDLRSGRAIVPIPRDTMPSFAASNNKIVWTLQVKGEIPRWPDVDEEFALTILPAEERKG